MEVAEEDWPTSDADPDWTVEVTTPPAPRQMIISGKGTFGG